MIDEAASGANGAGKTNPVLATVLEALSQSDRQSVLEILRNNRPKDSPLSGLAQNLQLKPEQEALFNVLLGLEQERGGVVDVEAEEAEERSLGGRNAGLQQELADLREVNDTLASALGACPACWGGDQECSECSGLGHPGSNRPNLALYRKLIEPAARRVASGRTTDRGFAGARRARNFQP
jgi:hypothetical protein